MKLIIDAGKDTQLIFEDILENIFYNSNSFTVGLEDNLLIVNIEDDENRKIYIDFVAGRIVNHILLNVEPKIIREEVELSCLDLLDDEIEENIAEIVEWELLHKNSKYINKYKEDLKEEISDDLEKHGCFNLLGFLNFRFNMRRMEIQDYVNIALEDYFNDEEDEQFANLLKRLVSIQQPQIDLVHVIMIGDNEYEIITSNRERVDIEEVQHLLEQQMFDDEYSEVVKQLHFIMSILMTISPAKITIHTNEKQDPYVPQMLKRIYSKRAIMCHGCEFCEGIRFMKEKE